MRSPTALAMALLVVTTPAWSGKKPKPQTAPTAQTTAAPTPAADPALASAVSYRHNLMEAMGKHMKLSSMIVRGQVTQPGDMLMHAQALHAAADALPTLFPKGSDPSAIPSDSLPAIWDDWEGFLKANEAYKVQTAKLVEAAKANDLPAFKAQFPQVGRTCGGCHDGYRVDED